MQASHCECIVDTAQGREQADASTGETKNGPCRWQKSSGLCHKEHEPDALLGGLLGAFPRTLVYDDDLSQMMTPKFWAISGQIVDIRAFGCASLSRLRGAQDAGGVGINSNGQEKVRDTEYVLLFAPTPSECINITAAEVGADVIISFTCREAKAF